MHGLVERAKWLPREAVMGQPHAVPQRLRWYGILALLAITALAAALRLWAVGWGLPYVDHPDEPEVARAALRMVQHGDWNPRFYDYPSLYLYALRIVFDGHWRYEHAVGTYTALAQLPTTINLNPAAFYLSEPGFFVWGRSLTAVVGALTVGLLGLIGWRWWHAWVGLAAAVALAVLPFHVRSSQYITVDVPTAFTTLLALGAAVRVIRHAQLRDYALAGFAVGLAASTKYNACDVCVALVVAHGMHWGRASLRQSWRLPWAGLCSLLGFVVGTPYAVLHTSEFVRGLQGQYKDYAAGGHGDLVGRWPVGGYLSFFWSLGLGPVIALVAAVGILVVLVRRDRAGLTVLAFVLAHVTLLMSFPQHFWRNLVPVLPPLALFAGIGIVSVAMALAAAFRGWRNMQAGSRAAAFVSGVSVLVIAAGVLAGPLASSVTLDQFDAARDVRLRAADYVRSHVPPDAHAAVELNPAQWQGSPNVVAVSSLTEHSAAWYRSHGFRYLVANDRYRSSKDDRQFTSLENQATLLCVLDDQSAAQLGPLVNLARTHASRFSHTQIEMLELLPAQGSAPARTTSHPSICS
jgi:4-amino-4-deoxy-L-arabinose transferase-like glycosyltransferase